MGVTSPRCACIGFLAAVASLLILPRPANAVVSLTVNVSASPDPVPAGAFLTYTIEVTNDGDQTALGVAIDSDVPPLTVFSAASDGGTLQPGNRVLWNIGSLAGFGAKKTVTLQVDVNFPLDPGKRIAYLVVVTADNSPPASGGTFTEVRGLGVNMAVTTEPSSCLGSPFRTYTIRFANGSTTSVSGLELSADLPPGTTLDSASLGGSFRCSTTPDICLADSDCPPSETCDTSKIVWDIGTLGSAELGIRLFTIRINDTEPAGTTYDSSAILDNGVESGSDSAPTTSIQDLPCPLLNKVALGAPTVEPGGRVQYLMTITNFGRVKTTNGTVSDPLPAGTTFGTADPSSCAGNGPAGTLGLDDVVRWSLGDMNPQDQLIICLELDVKEDIANSSVVNTATFADDEGDLVQDTEITGVQAVTALKLTKDAQPSPVEPGEQVTYTITFRNVADFEVTGVVITDNLDDVTPAGCVTFDPVATASCGGDVPAEGLSCSTSATACSADSDCPSGETCSLVIWNVGSVVQSAEVSVCYVVTIGTCDGQLRNVAQVTDDRGEIATATAKTRVTGSVSLRLFKEAPGQRRVKTGDDIVYTLRVQNLTAGTLSNVTITDDGSQVTPVGSLSFVSANSSECGGTGPDGLLQGNLATWTFASLAPGEQTVCLRATTSSTLAADDVIRNFAQATDDSGDLAEDSITTKVFVEAFRVRIIDQDDPVVRGGQIRYLISVENLGADDLAGVRIKGRVPSGTSLSCISGSTTSDCPPETDPAFQGVTLERDPAERGRRAIWTLDAPLTQANSVKKMRMTVTVNEKTRRRNIRSRAKAREESFRSRSKARAVTVVEPN